MTDVVLIGAGIMSATLAALLRKLDPSLTIEVFERLDAAAAESSDAWNNAGTGHSGFCELNYTPRGPTGAVDCSKAIQIAEQFELSKQLWAALAEQGELGDPRALVRPVPHLSFVWGDDDVAFLKERHRTLTTSPLFEAMQYSQDPAELAGWMPLVLDGRSGPGPLAATRMADGTDVNFGALTRALLGQVTRGAGGQVHLGHEVEALRRDGEWLVDVKERATQRTRTVRARFVFIGAGGYTLSLLERAGLPEADGYGAFPVSGQWLRCTNPTVIARHHAKVYGRAEVGAPPMSVPHLDSRWIDGRQELLFGPYAGVTTRFLKEGSWLDLVRSIDLGNLGPVARAGLANLELTRYLVGQALLSADERLETLRRYCPSARSDDWELLVAGLRVQIIKSDGKGGGVLKFGTEVVTSADGTMAGLLGASPGASTAVAIMLELIPRCFHERWAQWRTRCRELMPSFGRPLHLDAGACRAARSRWRASLGAA
ncbi:MAG: malate dehydrogenase (quinone) [Myxococcaceae bacterium]|nr:malate dehydrogenase (quinone) [Myxococcaceae bacterium]